VITFKVAYNNDHGRYDSFDDIQYHWIQFFKENEMTYTVDTKVGEILKDAKAVEILDKYAPGVSKNPMIGLAKGMTLTLLSMPQAKQAGINQEMVLKVLAEINARN
jgi:hypothetical protein